MLLLALKGFYRWFPSYIRLFFDFPNVKNCYHSLGPVLNYNVSVPYDVWVPYLQNAYGQSSDGYPDIPLIRVLVDGMPGYAER